MATDPTNKIKPRLPRGLADRGPAELAATRAMLDKIRAVFERYGFEAVETPAIEYTEALGKFLPDHDRPHEGVFSFQDDDEQWLSLRYDLTAPLARYVAENFDRLPKPYRSYRYGWVFRSEKPGPGRFRQFLQFDADTVGAASLAADAEICMMAADTLEHLGIARGDYVIKVNDRKVLDGVLQAIGLAGDDKSRQRLTVLRAIDKLDRLGPEGVRALLGAGRKDESGDFTKGAGLAKEQIELVIKYVHSRRGHVEAKGKAGESIGQRALRFISAIDGAAADHAPADNRQTLASLRAEFGLNPAANEGLDELQQIAELARAAAYGEDRILIDPSVVRGLEYYTGPVYEAELTFEAKDDEGSPVRFGSVAGGGRYDGLVARFRGEPVPAAGFSIGVSRLMAALQHLGKIDGKAEPGPVVVLVLDRERVADYQRMVTGLRNAGIRAELYLGDSGMKAQMKYADKRGAPCAVIQGSDERAKGEVQIKDLIEGAKASEGVASREEWREGRPAQFSVPEAKFIEAVRELLARHGINHR